MTYSEGIKKVFDYKTILITGDDTFFANQIVNKLKMQHKNIIRYDCKETERLELLYNIENRDLLYEERLFIVSDFDEYTDWSDILTGEYPDKVVFIASKSRIKKTLSNILHIECNKPKEWNQEGIISQIIQSYCKKKGYSIDADCIPFLYSKIGYNIYRILNEINKVFLFKGLEKSITMSDLNKTLPKYNTYNIYDLADLITMNKKKEALALLKTIYSQEPTISVFLISILYNHFDTLYLIKNNISLSYSKIPEFIVEKRIKKQAEFIDNKKIIYLLNFLEKSDYNIRKNSFDFKHLLEKEIINY